MEGSSEVRDMLEGAAAFERAGEISAAVARARAALNRAMDEESRDEARLALARLEQVERRWRAATTMRHEAFVERELTEDAGDEQRASAFASRGRLASWLSRHRAGGDRSVRSTALA